MYLACGRWWAMIGWSMQDVHLVPLGLLAVAHPPPKEDWRYAIAVDGGLSVMMTGTTLMQK